MENRKAERFTDLVVWQRAHELVLAIYKLTRRFPKTELYGLTAQIQRSAVSVAANIAEGFKKRGPSEKSRFYNISQGSLEECRYFLILSQDLGFADTLAEQLLTEEVGRLLGAYTRKLRE